MLNNIQYIFCDMDGVLVDYVSSIIKIMNDILYKNIIPFNVNVKKHKKDTEGQLHLCN
jgi:phosphoglycolate phosphatase-like HAD superfamily hydrolase